MSFLKRLFGSKDSGPQPPAASGDLGASLLDSYQAHVAQFRTPFSRVGCEKFVNDCLLGSTTLHRLSYVGAEKMGLTLADGKGHSASWDGPEVLWQGRKVHFMVETIPVGMSSAASWYSQQYGGYVQFITNVTNKLGHLGCGVFVHCIFGSDFANVGVLPIWQPDAVTSVIPRTCCTAEERAQFGI